ncbi:MAG: radical SAM protein [Desulfovermiculus sp.]|nr:radical SAM protein [Desulfovermiculus sp.]
MSVSLSCPAPIPYRAKAPIWPVFLPGLGCPSRCIYCDQRQQTGSSYRSLDHTYSVLAQDLAHAWNTGRRPFELAFFGGSFTALPRSWQIKFVDLARDYKHKGLITSVRCSTRPDCCSWPDLTELAGRGLDIVELGAQTFCPQVLHTCNRDYGPEAIRTASTGVRRAGMGLGIQLLPGLPEHDIRKWLLDIRLTCDLRPDFIRIYPCLVLQGTPLHRMYRQGRFTPWSLERTVQSLSRAYLRLWSADIPVIRMGLHPEPDLMRAIIAGPWHPGLGSLVRGRVLFALIRALCLHMPPGPKSMSCPKVLQGDLWGHQGVYRRRLHHLGLSPQRITYHHQPRIEITSLGG